MKRMLWFLVAGCVLLGAVPAMSQEKESSAPAAEDLKKSIQALEKRLSALQKEVGSSAAAAKDTTALKKLEGFVKETVETASGKFAASEKKLLEVAKSASEAKATALSTKTMVDEAAKAPKSDPETATKIESLKKDLEKASADAAKATGDVDGKATNALKAGDTAWMLVSSAFVLLMVPGLALFYGGMVRKKNVLATMMQSMAALAIVGVYWVAFGYGLAFGPSVGDYGIIGWSWKLFFLNGIKTDEYLPAYNVTVYAHVMFQGMFAIITPALISGALAERIRFGPYVIFMILWVTFVYCPLAHMVWAFDWFYDVPVDVIKGLGGSAVGYLGKMGALDFAGGTVVHIAAGAAALAAILVLRKRHGYPEQPVHPNSLVLTLTGAGLLWVGWFGFNGGSAVMSNALATSAFAATQVAAAAAGLTWMLVEWLWRGKPTALGLASGIVAGLVAVTPASGFVTISGAAAIGAIAGVVCYLAVFMKSKLGYDDSLDAFGVHGVGGFLGAVLTGIFCFSSVNSAGTDGYFAYQVRDSRIAELKGSTKYADVAAIEKATPALEEAKTKAAEAFDAAKTAFSDEKVDKKKEALKAPMEAAYAAMAEADAKLAEAGELKGLLEKKESLAKDDKGPFTQLFIQVYASCFALVYALILSAGLTLGVHVITGMNFTTDLESEEEGLDTSEHGEVGFDIGPSLLTAADRPGPMPRPAIAPPSGGKRFSLSVEGVNTTLLHKAWSDLCQEGPAPISGEFKAIYPNVSTVTGNKFRFSGGDPSAARDAMTKLLQRSLGAGIKVSVEA